MSEQDADDGREEMPPLVAAAHEALQAFILKHWLSPPDEDPGQAQQPPES